MIMATVEKKKIHKKNSVNSGKRAERNEVYNTRTWQNLRKLKLQISPLCENCLAISKIIPATQVHHVISFMSSKETRISLAYNMENLQSLCVACHHKIHNEHGCKH